MCCAGSNIAADNLALFAQRLGLSAIRVYAPSRELMESEQVA